MGLAGALISSRAFARPYSGFDWASRSGSGIWISSTGRSRITSSWMRGAIRTFLSGDDCCGEPRDEIENFLFVLGMRVSSVEAWFAGRLSMPFGILVNAGPRRLTTGELSSFRACRLVLTFPVLPAALSNERGVKNLLNDRGVTGGGRLGLRRVPASDTIEGGDDGISCKEGTWTGSDRGIAEGPGVLTIVLAMNVKRRPA